MSSSEAASPSPSASASVAAPELTEHQETLLWEQIQWFQLQLPPGEREALRRLPPIRQLWHFATQLTPDQRVRLEQHLLPPPESDRAPVMPCRMPAVLRTHTSGASRAIEAGEKRARPVPTQAAPAHTDHRRKQRKADAGWAALPPESLEPEQWSDHQWKQWRAMVKLGWAMPRIMRRHWHNVPYEPPSPRRNEMRNEDDAESCPMPEEAVRLAFWQEQHYPGKPCGHDATQMEWNGEGNTSHDAHAASPEPRQMNANDKAHNPPQVGLDNKRR